MQRTEGLQGTLKCPITGEHSAVKPTGPFSTGCSRSHDRVSDINPSVRTIQIQVTQNIVDDVDQGPWQIITVFSE